MNRLRYFCEIILLLLVGLIYVESNLAYPGGAPVAHTGATGETDCSNCHFGALDGNRPQLVLSGLGNVVRGGSRQLITLELSHPQMLVSGIQASIRLMGNSAGSAGQLHSDQLESIAENGIIYLNHSQPLQSNSGRVTVNLLWDVPQVSEKSVLNVAMVAANNDLSPFGDSVVKLEKIIEIHSN